MSDAATEAAKKVNAEAVLAVRGLKVAYGGIQAVKGIDLEVRRGELVALIGANGAGKTTTLKAITGTLCSAQIRTMATTSSVDCGQTTRSGGSVAAHARVLACCARTAALVTTRLPKARCSASVAWARASGVGPPAGAWRKS